MNLDKKIATRQSYGEELAKLGENNEKKWADLFTMPQKDGKIRTGMARCRVFSWLLQNTNQSG